MKRLRTVSCLFVVIVSLVAPAPARADDEPADERAELGEALTISGLTIFAGTYALTGAAATTLVFVANARNETIGESWIPLAGPWIMLADSAGFNGLQLALTVVSGVFQAASLAMLIAGLVLQSEGPSSSAVRVEPVASFGLVGLRLVGRF